MESPEGAWAGGNHTTSRASPQTLSDALRPTDVIPNRVEGAVRTLLMCSRGPERGNDLRYFYAPADSL